MSIKLEGFDEFLKAVKAMPDQMKRKTMREIIKANLKPVADTIRAKAPISEEGHKTTRIRKKDGKRFTYTAGNLQRSIGVRTFGTKGAEVAGYAGIQKGKNDGYYGYWVQTGHTMARGGKHIAANPFINRGAAIAVPKAAENLQSDIKGYIVKNAKKLGLDAK